MVRRHSDLMDERATAYGTRVPPDGFLFSLSPDCSEPLGPHYVTKRVAHLKDDLGIAQKSPETIARGPHVLVQHYSKSRRSGDRRAAEHLGRVVHSKR